jgi:2-succinyl-6-hydroxy-2,4-cyclohexadiene-1-carboxylate synthase
MPRSSDPAGRPERIQAPGLARLPAFSHASATGDLVFVSGTLGTKGDGFELVDDAVGPQTRQALENIGQILEASGCGFSDVVHCRVYLTDMGGFRDMNEAYRGFFSGEPPSRITVGCAALALNAKVEIECVARRPEPPRGVRTQRVARSTGVLEHDGEHVYWESVGEGDPLVLCHGAGGNHAIWFQQVPWFARTRRVVTWDHRGFGRSTDRAEESGPDAAVRDLRTLLDQLQIQRADLVGQSMGGWTVLGFALEHPERVRSLTLADTLGGITSPEIAVRQQELLGRSGGLDAGSELGLHPALDATLRDRDPARAYLYQMLGGFGEPSLARIAPRLFAKHHAAARLKDLDVPVLCIVGDRDPLFPPALVRAAAGLLTDSRVMEIPGCGHSPYFEAPDVWNAALLRFLESIDG